MFWPFNIPAKRREREAQQKREEAERLQRIKDSIEAENRRQRRRDSLISPPPTMSRPFSVSTSSTAPRSYASVYDETLSPLNPLSPTYQASQHLSSSLADEPRHSSPSHCSSSSSSHSHDHGSSYSSSDWGSSHSSHDHSCSSSSYDSGSSSSSSDW